jgi:hypothetical protein
MGWTNQFIMGRSDTSYCSVVESCALFKLTHYWCRPPWALAVLWYGAEMALVRTPAGIVWRGHQMSIAADVPSA